MGGGRVRKVVFVCIDGVADVATPQLGMRTPLQVARMPVVNGLARAGLTGMMDPVEPGLACGSDTAHMSMFGYDPRKYYRGRGAFECMGSGLDMNPGDIAFKSNFATIDDSTGIVVSRRADRNFEDIGPILCDYLDGMCPDASSNPSDAASVLPSFPNHRVSVKYATEHRCGVRVSGPDLTDEILGTDPLKDNLPLLQCLPSTNSPRAATTARLVEELSRELRSALSEHEINADRKAKGLAVANVVLLRGCGCRIQVKTFEELHGFKAFAIAPTAIIGGLAMSIGMKRVQVKGATGDYHTDLQAKANAALNLITDAAAGWTFGFVHVKAVDDAGHDKNAPLKVKFLEEVDRMVGTLVRGLEQSAAESGVEYVLALTGDHSTPVEFGDHSCEPVPFFLCKVPVDPAASVEPVSPGFNEVDCACGTLGRFPGSEMMSIIKQACDAGGVVSDSANRL